MPNEFFKIGRYWIGTVPGSPNFYRFWYDRGTGQVRRRSLGTADFEAAKLELAVALRTEGSGKSEEPKDVRLTVVLGKYWAERTDQKRSPSLPRKAGAFAIAHFGTGARVGDLTRSKQVEFIRHLHDGGYSVGYIARLMTSLQAALNFSVAHDDDDSAHPLTRAPRLIYKPKAVAEVLSAAEPEPNNWHPDLTTVGRWLDGLGPTQEYLRRLTVLIIGFGGARAEAALEATPAQLDHTHRLVRLNPVGRRQTHKYRPTVPVPDVLWPVLLSWSNGETFCGCSTARYVTRAWNRERERLGLPEAFTPRSLRHLTATELRHAHKRYGVPRVPTDEIEMMMGHRRPGMNARYGAYEPDYLAGAAAAVNAVLVALDALCAKPFLPRQGAKLRVVG